jgi:carbohydrate diacid regulator
MVVSAALFEQVAASVSERAADLLDADVFVTDQHGVVVASSTRGSIGLTFPDRGAVSAREILRIPIHLDSHAGEVIVTESGATEQVPARVARALIHMMISQATVVANLPNHYELKNKFIHDLLMDTFANDDDVIREGQVLGMDFASPRAVVLIDASAYVLASGGEGLHDRDGSLLRRRVQTIIASIVAFFNLPNDAICGYIGNGEIAILKASSTRDLVAWTSDETDRVAVGPSWANVTALKRAAAALLSRLRCDTGTELSIGIGRYHPGVRGLSLSYRDAAMALTLGKRLHGPDLVHCLDRLGIAAFVGVSDERIKLDLARHLLSPLEAEPQLVRTLETFFTHDCSPSTAASELGIHRNTLSYRLDRIALLIGLDPRHFDQAVQIRAALLLRSFHPDNV